MQAYLKRQRDAFTNPAGLHVLGQSWPVNHDHVGGAGGIKLTFRETARKSLI
jgi:hypothetical protein